MNPPAQPRFHRPSSIALACAIVFIAGFVIQTHANLGALLTLAFDGLLLLFWIAAMAGIGAALLKLSRLACRPLALRFALAFALGTGAISLVILGLGLVGWLNRATAMLLIGLGAVIGLIFVMRNRQGRNVEARPSMWLGLLVALSAGVTAGAATAPPGVLWGADEPNGYDVVEYHLQIPREWFELGRIVPLRHNVFSFFPFAVEMHYLLAMQLGGGAWAGAYLAQLMHTAMMVFTALAIYGVLTELGASLPGAVLGASLFATTPWIMMLGAIAYNEGGMVLFGTLAIGLALVALQQPLQRVRLMSLAGVLAGFAGGTKLTAVPFILFAVPVCFVVVARQFRPAIAFAIAGLLSISPWLVRNTVWTSNPVFPEAMAIFGRAHFSEAQAQRWARAHAPRADQRPVAARLRAAGEQLLFDWRFGLTIPIACGAIALTIRRRLESRMLAILLLVMFILWIAFTHLQGRFFVLSIPIAAILIGLACRHAACAVFVAGVSLAGIVAVHVRISQLDAGMRERSRGTVSLFDTLGLADPRALTAVDQERFPPEAHVVLIGDASAFWYEVPGNRLHYKTVFDVDVEPGQSILDAWRAGTESLPSPVVDVIDPAELRRFSQTYFSIPPPADEVGARQRPYVQMR